MWNDSGICRGGVGVAVVMGVAGCGEDVLVLRVTETRPRVGVLVVFLVKG